MPISLHTDKIKTEKDYFVHELYQTISPKDSLMSNIYTSINDSSVNTLPGDKDGFATRIHKLYLSLHIMANYSSEKVPSNYFNGLLSCLIESESLFLLGFRNSGVMLLRSAVELSFKLLYFTYHPIEQIRDQLGNFDLHALDYREFLYLFPQFQEQKVLDKPKIEKIWKELCAYTHCDLKKVDQVTLVENLKPIYEDESSFSSFLKLIKESFKIIVNNLFLSDPEWLKEVEKSYVDYVFEILFTPDETSELKIKYRLY